MGMTDKQFNSYVRLLLAALRDVLKALRKGGDQEEALSKLDEIVNNLQQSIED